MQEGKAIDVSYIAGENVNDKITLENSVMISYGVKHMPTIRPNNSISWYLPKRNENIQVHKYCNMNVSGSFTHNSKSLDKMSNVFP